MYIFIILNHYHIRIKVIALNILINYSFSIIYIINLLIKFIKKINQKVGPSED